MKLTLSSIACLFVSASSLDKYAFVSDQTCEAYGMESIHDAAVCEEAASHLAGTNGIRSDYKFIDVTDWKGPGRPNGCSYHRFGNVEQWHHGYDEDCTVNGFAGCFCKVVEYEFVSDKNCEDYGMESIHDPAECKAAASQLAGTNGIRSDYKFIDVTDYTGPGRPNGCSYHRFGNVEQWHHGYDEDCTVNGFAGCFCKVVPYEFVSDKNCEDYGMESIYDPAECKAAASQLAGTNGIRPDYKFIDVTGYKGPGRPKGCSYHRFGNVEQWHHGYDEECTVNGFAGCFCKPVAGMNYH